jgi:hypothetical protein
LLTGSVVDVGELVGVGVGVGVDVAVDVVVGTGVGTSPRATRPGNAEARSDPVPTAKTTVSRVSETFTPPSPITTPPTKVAAA